jgi:uncharacterized membrane protein
MVNFMKLAAKLVTLDLCLFQMTHNVLNAQVQNIVMNVVPHTIFLTMLVVKQQHTTMEQNVTHVLQVVYLVLEPLLKNVLVAMPDTNLPPVVNVLQIPK